MQQLISSHTRGLYYADEIAGMANVIEFVNSPKMNVQSVYSKFASNYHKVQMIRFIK